MRWDHLFDDLESQLERELTAEDLDVEAEEERLRLGRLSVRDRLVALSGSNPEPLTVTLVTGERLELVPETFGRDWFSARVVQGAVPRRQCIVPVSAIAWWSLSPRQVRASLSDAARDARAEASLSMRLGMPFVLRDLCRRRRAVDLLLALAGTLHGTIDRVGRDHLDLAVHEPGSPRRASQVSEVLVVPLASVALLAH